MVFHILAERWPDAILNVGFSIPIQCLKGPNQPIPQLPYDLFKRSGLDVAKLRFYTKMKTRALAVQLPPMHILRAPTKHCSNAVDL
jgi:hypothetical protein